jgi:hypothetical protein
MKPSQTIFSMISSKPAHHAKWSSPRNSPHAAESRSPSALSIRTGKPAATKHDAVIPSEVEAATQPRKRSGRGQAFNPDGKPAVQPRDRSTSLPSLRMTSQSSCASSCFASWRLRGSGRGGLQDQHAIAVTVEAILFTDRFLVGTNNEIASSKGTHQHQ